MFQENKTIGQIKFDYLEKGEPLNYCTRLAQRMHLFRGTTDFEHILRSQYVADTFDREKTAEVVGCKSRR